MADDDAADWGCWPSLRANGGIEEGLTPPPEWENSRWKAGILMLKPEPNTATLFSAPSGAGAAPGPDQLQYPGKRIERAVPFSDLVTQGPPTDISREHLEAGLASTFSTTIDNPFFKLPSAQDEQSGAVPAAFAMYGPYYIGTNLTPEQIAVDVATRAACYLRYLDCQHSHDGYVGRLMSVLRTGHLAQRGPQSIEDRHILVDVDGFLAGITHQLRHIAPVAYVNGRPSSPAEVYRDESHDLVDPYVHTVSIGYGDHDKTLRERFVLPQFIRSDPAKLVTLGWDFFSSWELRRAAEFAALAAERVGNPLVRESLQEHYIPLHARMLEYR
jgi:hypothetical protein